jgi:hypothetical protein
MDRLVLAAFEIGMVRRGKYGGADLFHADTMLLLC